MARSKPWAALLATALSAAALALPAGPTRAATTDDNPSVLAGQTESGQAIPCTARTDGIEVCHGSLGAKGAPDLRLKSFDGTALDIYVTLPAGYRPGTAKRYPLVVQSHGWGDPPSGPDDPQFGGPTAATWASQGYVVVEMAARGWGGSCGTPASRKGAAAACKHGYIHLDDYRYEARDVQYVTGLLVDEGIVDPHRIGVTGESYGGGVTLELATLKDRVMLPNGKLTPWRSPDGTPLRIAAAAPFATWSDLVYALAPNGRTTDSAITSTTADLSPVGVMKTSIMSGLYLVGTESGHFATPGSDPEADVTKWYALVLAGEPYTLPQDKKMVQEIAQYRSPYYLLAGAYGMKREAPAPVFLANGFTDDVFPVDESLRYLNYVRKYYPNNPIGAFFYDGGHQRGNNKAADGELLHQRIDAFFAHYVKGEKAMPWMGVTALTQTCPTTAPSRGPYHAATWAQSHPRSVTHTFVGTKTVLSVGGNPAISKTFDPVFGGLACTTAPSKNQGPGIATYDLPVTQTFTLLGAPSITATVKATGVSPYVAARLLDVDPATKKETLIARGTYRFTGPGPASAWSFQLHPAGWQFAKGHVVRLELLGEDTPYTRPANGAFTLRVSDLRLRLPVR